MCWCVRVSVDSRIVNCQRNVVVCFWVMACNSHTHTRTRNHPTIHCLSLRQPEVIKRKSLCKCRRNVCHSLISGGFCQCVCNTFVILPSQKNSKEMSLINFRLQWTKICIKRKSQIIQLFIHVCGNKRWAVSSADSRLRHVTNVKL